MIALSVMRIPSGHTSLQHFVMLQSGRPAPFASSSVRSTLSSGCISRLAIRVMNRGPK
jgi:hypothetical protein